MERARSTESLANAWQTLTAIVSIAAEALHLTVNGVELAASGQRDAVAAFRVHHTSPLPGPWAPHCGTGLPNLLVEAVPDGRTHAAHAISGDPERWRYEEAVDRVTILRFRGGEYRARRESAVLVPLTDDLLTRLVRSCRRQPPASWQGELRSWIRAYD